MRNFIYNSLANNDSDVYLIFESLARIEKKHTHDFLEIVYTLNGCIRQNINGDIFDCYRGDLILIDVGSIHSFKPLKSASYFNLCIKFDDELLEKTHFNELKELLNKKMISINGDTRREIEGIFQSMYSELRKNDDANYEIVKSYLNILILKIIRIAKEEEIEKQEDQWNKILKYIDDNIDEQLSLHKIAGKCFYNPSYFSRLFKRKIGVNFITYVNDLKIKKSKVLLKNQSLSINEISKQLGFASIQVFYKTFNEFTGMSPAKYRDSLK